MKRILIALFFAIVALAYLFPETLFSPGPVHRAHADIARCTSCHSPFAKADAKGTCTQSGCHDPARWGAQKGTTKSHRSETGCLRCHTEHKGREGTLTLLASHDGITQESRCDDCHVTTASHPLGESSRCGACHTITAWKPATFDHALLDSKRSCSGCHALTAKHTPTTADCHRCHGTTDWKKVAMSHDTLLRSDRCDGCHALPQQHAQTTGDCVPCHTTTKWKPATFDHARLEPGGGCRECHALPMKHFTTKERCVICHDVKAWKPARFVHSFPMRHGERKRPNECATCHPDSLSNYSCASCHSGFGLRMEHLEEGVIRFDDQCVRCHTFRPGSGHKGLDGGKGDNGKFDNGKDDD